MKDEEIAEEYKEKHICNTCADIQECGNDCPFSRCAVQGFLAGLKAGRPQWHFVSKEGHPTEDNIYLIIRKDGLHLGDYCQGGDGDIDCQSWCDYPSEDEIQDDSVIAWCEIPTFDKE